MRKKIVSILVIILFVLTVPDISPLETAQSKDSQVNGKLKINIDFNRSSTPASNQYAVWIEDMDGNVVKTLFVTNFTSSSMVSGTYWLQNICQPGRASLDRKY